MKNKKIASLSLRKLMLSALVAAPLATLPVPLWALPSSATNLANQVASTSGATVGWVSGTQVNVTASATNSVVRWVDFGSNGMTINSGDKISYSLPTSSSSILNVVTTIGSGHDTTINGRLETDRGNLYILNPNGITVGATGVILANAVGLSTVSETEYNFLQNGQLTYVNNQPPIGTAGNITLSPGAAITAASGTGNVWVVGGNITLAGTIDAGNVSVTAQNSGYVILGSGGTLTIGDTTNLAGNLSVTGTNGITVSGANNVVVYGPSVSLNAGNSAIALGTGYLQIGTNGANATLTTNSGTANTSLGDGSSTAAGGLRTFGSTSTLTLNATGNNVTVSELAGDLALGATTAGNLNAWVAAGNVTFNASTVKGALAVTAVGGNVFSSGNVSVTGSATIVADAGKDVTFAGKASSISISGAGSTRLGTVTISSTDTLQLGATAAVNYNATAAKDITMTPGLALDVSPGNVSITSTGGNVTLSQGITATNLTVTANKNVTQQSSSGLSIATAATFTAQNGDVSLDALTIPTITATAGGNVTLNNAISASKAATLNAGGKLNLNSTVSAPTLALTGGTITQTAAITSTKTATITGNTSVVLNNTSNDFGNVVVKGGATDISITDANGIVLAGGTNATGNVSITAVGSPLTIGAAGGDTITVGGNLSLTNSGAGTITENSNNVTVTGTLSATTAGQAITLAGATGNGVGLNNSYGKVNLTSGGADASIMSSSALNLGAINLGAGNLKAYSATGITNSGKITATNVKVGAGTATAPGDIALNYVGNVSAGEFNSIAGTVTILTDLELLAPSSQPGKFLAKNLTVVNGIDTAATPSVPNGTVYIPANLYGESYAGNVSVATVGNASLRVGQIVSTGAVSLASGNGSITALGTYDTVGSVFKNDNAFSNLTVTTNGNIGNSSIQSTQDLTINETVGATANKAITYTSGGNITLGVIKSAPDINTTFAATGSVTDTQAIWMYGSLTVNAASVSLIKTGHNFGKINIDTHGANGAVTVVEGGTMNVNNISAGSGAVSLTSANGDILENAGNGTIATTGAVVLNAANGAVTANGAANTIGGVSLLAKNDSTLLSTANVVLGTSSITAGNLTVTAAGQSITEKSGATLNIYGATTISGGSITLDQSGNQFGALSLTAGGNITIKESGTMNLAAVSTTAAFNATSETADIVDSGVLAATGTSTFNAKNVSLTKSSDFGTVFFTVPGNVTIKDANAIVLGGATIGGNLTVTAVAGDISQPTNGQILNVTGDTTLNATAGAVTLANTGNMFGTLQFKVLNTSIIDQLTNLNLRAGSSATGSVTLNTGGNFATTGIGGSTFNNNLTINATGTITPGANSLLVSGTFTVNASGTKDLSLLSYGGNLNSHHPVYLGTGSNIKPPDEP